MVLAFKDLNSRAELFIKSISVLKNMKLVWLIIPLVLFSIVGMPDSFGQTVQWSVQFGSDSFEGGHAISVDPSGNVYVTGTTSGSLFATISGESDAFVAKYDTDGNQVWAKQFGSDLHDGSNNITINSSGNVYVTGTTSGSISGTNVGSDDAFVAKYDTDGNQMWAKQFGNNSLVEGIGVAADSSGNAYVTGYARGDLFDTNAGVVDAFVAKYDTDGNQVWAKQFGSEHRDIGFGITADSSGNVYVTGHTDGDLFGTNTGAYDVFVVRYNPDGIEKWAKQFGNNSLEEHGGITTDSLDNMYVTGIINDNPSSINIGSDDVFITKYAKNGIEKWAKQFGSSSFEGGNDIAADSSGNVYVTGITSGSLFSTIVGESDAFIIKYDTQIVASQPSLKHQIENTIPINNITCKNEDHILAERTNKKLACVYLNTAEKLDWKSIDPDVIILSQSVKESLLIRYQDMPEVVAFYAKYNDAQASVREDHISYVSGSDEGLKIRMNLFFNEDDTIIDKSLTCYYKRAFQFESPSEDVLYRLQSNECKQSTNGFDLSKIGEN
ncbi:MAG: SBBP repeat-containing protein [Nitrosopumilus sp.]